MARASRIGFKLGMGALVAAAVGFLSCRTTQGPTAAVKDTVADKPQFVKTQLEMSGDPGTGTVSVRFDSRAANVPAGTTLDLEWDVVRAHVDVNCSSLKRHETVTVPAGDGKVALTFQVAPSLLTDSLVPGTGDPAKVTKYGGAGINGFKGDTVIAGCLAIPGQGLVAQGSALPDAVSAGAKSRKSLGLADEGDDDSALPIGTRYAERCAKAIGYIKPFSCVDDGRTVPITVEGVEQTRFVKKCDRPQYLTLGGPTQCATNTRVNRMKVYTDKTYTTERTDSLAVFFCRHYEDPVDLTPIGGRVGPDYPYFHDVAIIEQNKESGKTCYFQALGGGRPQGEKDEDLYGLRVPSPTETNDEFEANTTPEQKTAGAQHAWPDANGGFWLSPGNIGAIHCVSCHDSDPFMHSPWIDQMKVLDASNQPTDKLLVPSNARGIYKIISGGVPQIKNWDTSYSVKTADSACESCHRIGSMNTCRTWSKDAYPLHDDGVDYPLAAYYDPDSKGPWATKHPNHHWMPPPPADAGERTDWEASLPDYKASATELRQCCTLKKGGKTLLSYGQIMQPTGHKLSQADIDYLGTKGCTVAPITEVVDR